MQPTVQTEALEQPMTLTEIVPAVRMLPAFDKLRLIRILAEELESAKEIFPFESGKTYYLPTPYNSYGAAAILAEAMAAYCQTLPAVVSVIQAGCASREGRVGAAHTDRQPA